MQQPKSKEFLRLCKKYGVDPDNVNEVLSFEAACAITGDDPKVLPIVSKLPQRRRKRLLADHMLIIIAEALRADLSGKKPVLRDVDYTSSDWKYFALFIVNATKKNPSGSGLSSGDFDRWHSHSCVGVRLCFFNPDTAIFFGKHFLKLHEDHHL